MNNSYLTRILVTFLLIGGCQLSFAQESGLQFSLEEARTYAVEHSYFTQKAILDQKSADKKMKEVTAIGLPQVSAGADITNFIERSTQLLPSEFGPDGGTDPIAVQFGTNYSIGGTLTVSQLIFNGSYIVGLQAARVYREMAEKQVVKSEREIKDAVTQAYGNVIVAVENYETIKGNKDFLAQTLTETQALYESGFAQEQDVDQLKILVQSANIQFNRADRLREISENFLKFQMGIETANTIVLTDSLNVMIAYGNDSTITAQLFDVNSHIDYEIAINNQELKLMNLKNKKAAFLPSLSAFYQYNQSYQSNDLSLNSDYWFPSSMVGLQLNIPIFSSGERTFIKQQAEFNLQKAKIDTRMAEESLTIEFLTKKSEYQFSVDQYKNSKDNMELVQKIVTRETQKYQEGMSSSLNLANAQIQFFQIQGAYIQSIMEMINARSHMDKILSNY